ncbi:MAG: hypothetical protein ABSA66_15240 [Roseiarcus sp.]|jgi:hypothetical protein
MPAMPARREGRFASGIGAKIWSEAKISFFPLQASDFPQNAQRNPWKYLQKKAANLEMLGVGLEKLAAPKVRQRTNRVFSRARPRPSPRPREALERQPDDAVSA